MICFNYKVLILFLIITYLKFMYSVQLYILNIFFICINNYSLQYYNSKKKATPFLF